MKKENNIKEKEDQRLLLEKKIFQEGFQNELNEIKKLATKGSSIDELLNYIYRKKKKYDKVLLMYSGGLDIQKGSF